MNSGKIIQINPDLFKISNRTKKNRSEKSNVSIPKPIIATSTIRRKLLNRVKQKKSEENNSVKKREHNSELELDQLTNEILENDDINEDEENDELSNAMNYFDSMSDREKQRQKMLSKTYKNRNNSLELNNISLNIPYPLRHNEPPKITSSMINDVTSSILDDLPYGCLKGGNKPTYKNWMNSIKNYSSMSNTDVIRPPTPPKKRFEDKDKDTNKEIIFTEKEYKESLFSEPDKHKENKLKKQIDDRLKRIESEQHEILTKFDDDIEPPAGGNVSNKQYVKKIIKRKYTLGKSSKYRKVGVLIKGRQTKKNIINSHKKIKHTDIHHIKKYLKKRGMLKTGSSCPDEILRKMYESTVLSGEINNTNKNTLIHNFLNDDETIK